MLSRILARFRSPLLSPAPCRTPKLGSGFEALESRDVPNATITSWWKNIPLTPTADGTAQLVTGPNLTNGQVYEVMVQGSGQIGKGKERTGADAEYIRWGKSGTDGRDLSVAPEQNTGVRMKNADTVDGVSGETVGNLWGGPRADHNYSRRVIGQGKPLIIYYRDMVGKYGDNSDAPASYDNSKPRPFGALRFMVFRITPTPPVNYSFEVGMSEAFSAQQKDILKASSTSAMQRIYRLNDMLKNRWDVIERTKYRPFGNPEDNTWIKSKSYKGLVAPADPAAPHMSLRTLLILRTNTAITLMASGTVQYAYVPDATSPDGRSAWVVYENKDDNIPIMRVHFNTVFFSDHNTKQIDDLAHEIGRLVGFHGQTDHGSPNSTNVHVWDNMITNIVPLWQ